MKLAPTLVGVGRFELPASWTRTMRATNCATPRNHIFTFTGRAAHVRLNICEPPLHSHYIIIIKVALVKKKLPHNLPATGIYMISGGGAMRECKVYLASALFICLTAVKLCFPSVPDRLRRQGAELLCSGTDYGKAIQAIGRSLAQGQLEEQLVQVLEYINPPEDKTVPAGETCWLPFLSGDGAASLTAADIPASLLAGEDALSGRVSLDAPQLPFDHCSPVEGTVSSRFGSREDPLDSEPGFHYGTDIAADSGTQVLAFASGQVSHAGTDDGYGNYCIVQHSDGYATLYAHLSKCIVSSGQEVEEGQVIGCVGQTGRATGPHLHFELSCQGLYLDPENYL